MARRARWTCAGSIPRGCPPDDQGALPPAAHCHPLALVPNGAAPSATCDAADESGSAGAIGVSMFRIAAGGLDDPRVLELLRVHVTTARAETARGSAHALDVSGLRSSDIEFRAIWDDTQLLGIGALKRLLPNHAEVKSMHTARAARRRGVGNAMLRHIIAAARARGFSHLSLETGAGSTPSAGANCLSFSHLTTRLAF